MILIRTEVKKALKHKFKLIIGQTDGFAYAVSSKSESGFKVWCVEFFVNRYLCYAEVGKMHLWISKTTDVSDLPYGVYKMLWSFNSNMNWIDTVNLTMIIVNLSIQGFDFEVGFGKLHIAYHMRLYNHFHASCWLGKLITIKTSRKWKQRRMSTKGIVYFLQANVSFSSKWVNQIYEMNHIVFNTLRMRPFTIKIEWGQKNLILHLQMGFEIFSCNIFSIIWYIIFWHLLDWARDHTIQGHLEKLFLSTYRRIQVFHGNKYH